MEISKVTSKFQATVPADIRKALGIEAGDTLAWISLEGNRTLLNHALTVRHWPGGGEERVLAAAHAHGAWIEWMAA